MYRASEERSARFERSVDAGGGDHVYGDTRRLQGHRVLVASGTLVHQNHVDVATNLAKFDRVRHEDLVGTADRAEKAALRERDLHAEA